MSKLVFFSSVDVKKHDSSFVFTPEAKAFGKFYSVPTENIIPVDCTLPALKRRNIVLDKLSKVNDIEVLMFFCHGYSNGLQFGFKNQNVEELAASINFTEEMKIGIFACSTADNNTQEDINAATNNSFSDRLRDSLNSNYGWNGWIDAHKTAGHSTFNPYVVRFHGQYNLGGNWLVGPDDFYWKKWSSYLHNNTNNLRYRFLTLEKDQILKELSK